MKNTILVGVVLILLLGAASVHAAAPLNDNCWSAQELYITMTGSGSTAQATVDGDSTCGGSGGPDVWYKYYATTTGFLSVSTLGSAYDTVLSIHDSGVNGCPGDDSDTIACNDDCVAGSFGYSCITNTPIQEGHYYYIRVSGYNGATGNFSLSFGKATINGKVIDSATSLPIAGASVYAKSKMDPVYPQNSAAYASTDASGNYSLIVPGGSYQIVAGKLNYLQEAYDGILCGDGCSNTTGSAVTVTNGQVVNSINFSLDLAGSVSGTVTDKETGAPLANVHVYLDATEFNGGIFSSKFATTDASGHYTATMLAPGTYYPFVSQSGYEPQLYSEIPCTHCAKRTDGTPVFVAAGTNTTGVDFELRQGSTVSGTITDEVTNLPIQNASVKIRGVGGVSTDAAGHYSISGVPAGPQVLVVGASNYVYEVYNDVPCSWFSTCNTANGTTLNVPANTTLSGIDVALAPEGKISGTITDAVTSQPLSSVDNLGIYDSTGTQLVLFGCCSGPNFTFTGLAQGDYYVTAGAIGYITKLYSGTTCPGNSCNILGGTKIHVTKGQTTTGVNFALTPAGSISGTVTSGAAPLRDAVITVYDNEGNVVIDNVEADDYGKYEVKGLPTGSYFVRAMGGPTSVNKHYIPKIYNNVDCIACVPHVDGAPVFVTAGAQTTGINFTLNQGSAISGKVVGAIGGAPLNAKLTILDDAGNLVSDAKTDGSGQYVSKIGLPAGNYYVFADSGDGYTSELYNDVPCAGGNCPLNTGDFVLTTAGTTTPNINFGLFDCSAVSMSPSVLPTMTDGQPFSQQMGAAGGTGPYLYYLSSGALPTGVSLTSAGLLSGTPDSGDFSFEVRVYDSNGCMRTRSYAVSIPAAPCMFCDDFEDGTPAADWSYAKGLWGESGGSLNATPSGKTGSAYATPAFGGCTNCYMETSMQTSGGALNKMWFFPWYQNKNNTVEVLMKEENDKWIVRQRVNGVIVNKSKGLATINPGQFYTVRVEYTGNSFVLSVDGAVLAVIPATGTPFGTLGFQVKNTIGSFGYVKVN